jgi:fatty-acyl-CoA synthase
VTPGYLETGRTRELYFESNDGECWLNTGDLCTIDNDGYVWLRGRSKDLIIRGGHNIDPQVIEAALVTHPAVMHAAAIGEPDRDKGELPVAYVQLRPDMAASEAELLAHCRREISERAALPRAVRIVEAMPVTAVGKIFKPALRIDALRRCVAAVLARLDGTNGVSVDVRDAGGAISVVVRANPSSLAERDRVRRELEHYTFRVELESVAPTA